MIIGSFKWISKILSNMIRNIKKKNSKFNSDLLLV